MSFHRAWLEELAREFDIFGNDMLLQQGAPANELRKICKEGTVDIVVMGMISGSMIIRAVIGSTAERVLDRLPCDFLLVKPDGFVIANL